MTRYHLNYGDFIEVPAPKPWSDPAGYFCHHKGKNPLFDPDNGGEILPWAGTETKNLDFYKKEDQVKQDWIGQIVDLMNDFSDQDLNFCDPQNKDVIQSLGMDMKIEKMTVFVYGLTVDHKNILLVKTISSDGFKNFLLPDRFDIMDIHQILGTLQNIHAHTFPQGRISVKEKLRLLALENVKKMVIAFGDHFYEFHNPEDAIIVKLPNLDGTTDEWVLTTIEQPSTQWWVKMFLAADPDTRDATPLDDLDYETLGRIVLRIYATEEEEEKERNYHFTCSNCGYEWEEEYSCACDDRCPECNRTNSPDAEQDETGWSYMGPSNLFVLQMQGDIEPVIHGPFSNEETVLAVAKRRHREEPDDTICHMKVDWENHQIEAFAFGYNRLEENEEE